MSEEMNLTIEDRAREIATFLGKPYDLCLSTLRKGFGYLHGQVAEDWRKANPQTDAEILEWYRTTQSYIFELSSYHLDPGYNYSGMLSGISEALRAKGVRSVLCLGDGIGDLTLKLCEDGFDARYHDLEGSRTAAFAESRLIGYQLRPAGWSMIDDATLSHVDAVVSLDFLEHVADVPYYVRTIYDVIRPGGWFMAQNAFGIGSGDNGSIPMHLERNDRFEKDWDPLLKEIGFVQASSNWYQKP